jgi:hypothetical protein
LFYLRLILFVVTWQLGACIAGGSSGKPTSSKTSHRRWQIAKKQRKPKVEFAVLVLLLLIRACH